MVIDERRDHAIRAPRPDLTVKIGTPNACNGCHTKESPQWAADATAKWYGPARANTKHYGEAIHAGRRDLPGAERDADAARERCVAARDRARDGAVAAARLPRRPIPAPCSRRRSRIRIRCCATPRSARSPTSIRACACRCSAPLLVDPVRTVRIDAARALASVPATQVPEALQPMVASRRSTSIAPRSSSTRIGPKG